MIAKYLANITLKITEDIGEDELIDLPKETFDYKIRQLIEEATTGDVDMVIYSKVEIEN